MEKAKIEELNRLLDEYKAAVEEAGDELRELEWELEREMFARRWNRQNGTC